MKLKQFRCRRVYLLVPIIMVILQSCSTIDEEFVKAAQKNTIDAYGYFISSHNEHEPLVQQATERKELLELAKRRKEDIENIWAATLQSRTLTESYEPYISYGNPFTFDVNKSASLSGNFELSRVLVQLETWFRDKVDKYAGSFSVDDQTSNQLRIRVHGIKNTVLSNSDYWEYLFLTVFLSIHPPNDQENLTVAKILEQLDRQNSLEARGWICDHLKNAELSPKTKYTISMNVSGKYKAGGKPSSITGYADMITDGHSAELDYFSSSLMQKILRWGQGPVQTRFDMRTGCETYSTI